MTDDARSLLGGNVSTVVRVGDTVRREKRPWSDSTLALLRHLEQQGLDCVPRTHGFDDQGREVLQFIPGQVGIYPVLSYMRTDETLLGAARLLRDFHDATANYEPPAGAVWQLPRPEAGLPDVICHNDFAPYNLVFQDGRPRALIDFDTAGPGPRIWDVAYAAYRFVPLSNDEHSRALGWENPLDRGRRLRLFCDAYGLPEARKLPRVVEDRLRAMCDTITRRAEAGDPAFRQMIAEGHLGLYERDIDFLARNRATLEQSIVGQTRRRGS